MAHPMPAGLLPPEIAFLCEMELVTVIPRERLNSLQLLGGTTPSLRPPHRANLPLWLALLLKRQRRADIAPPPWLHPAALQAILDDETSNSRGGAFSEAPPLPAPESTTTTIITTTVEALASGGGDALIQPTPPFQHSNTSTASPDHLPYHWLEMSQLLLTSAADDIPETETVRRLLRDLREVRAAKVRAGFGVLDGGAGVLMNGVGAMEVGEARGFVTGVVDGLRRVGAAREAQGREEAEERKEAGGGVGGGRGAHDEEDEDEDML